jgi:hypothetical protein
MWRVVLLSSAVLAFAAAVIAETYVVNPEGTGDFPTIQAAIDAVVDGDVIELADGTFTGEGNRDIDYLGKAITIRSRNGNPSYCIIDCEGSETDPHRGFVFDSSEGSSSVLAGITITNGFSPCGGGVRCDYASPTIVSCAFLQNSSPECEGGGALFWGGGMASVRHCVFAENTAGLGGAAASCNGANTTFECCTFIRNTADRGGGLRV